MTAQKNTYKKSTKSAQMAWERYMNREIITVLTHMVLGVIWWFYLPFINFAEGATITVVVATITMVGGVYYRFRWDYIGNGVVRNWAFVCMSLPLFAITIFGWTVQNQFMNVFYLAGICMEAFAYVAKLNMTENDIGFRWVYKKEKERMVLRLEALEEKKAIAKK